MKDKPTSDRRPGTWGRIVVAALVGALLGAGLTGGVLGRSLRAKDDALRAAQMTSATTLSRVRQLQGAVTDLKSQVSEARTSDRKLEERLHHQQYAHQRADQQVATLEAASRSRIFVHILAVDAAGRSVTFDRQRLLTGETADAAYARSGGTPPVPNDYFILDSKTDPETLPVATAAPISLLYDRNHRAHPDGIPVGFAIFARAMNGTSSWARENQHWVRGYWLTIGNDTIIRIEAWYSP